VKLLGQGLQKLQHRQTDVTEHITSRTDTSNSNVYVDTGGGGGWISRHQSTAGLTDGRGVLGELVDKAAGGRPCNKSTVHGWQTQGGFGGGGGGCLAGGGGGGYTGASVLLIYLHYVR